MRYSILSLLVLVLYSSQAQQGFIKAYNFGYPNSCRFDAMIIDEFTLVLCGYLYDSIPPYQQGMFFSKMDTLGQVTTFKTYYDDMGYYYGPAYDPGNSLIKLQDEEGYAFISVLLQNGNGCMMKFDNEGNRLWTKIYENNNVLSTVPQLLHETPDGFLIAGIQQIPNLGTLDIFLMKTDKEGNKLWEKSFGVPNRDEFLNSFIALNNNEYLLAGYDDMSGQSWQWNQSHTHIQIIAVDSLGNEKWTWESDPPQDDWTNEDIGCYGLHREENGDWVYATLRGEHDVLNGMWYQRTNTQAQFVVRDSNFNLITERVYDELDGYYGADGVLNMISLSDGDWLSIGSNLEYNIFPPDPDPNPTIYAYLNRISNGGDGESSLGDSLWTRLDFVFPDSITPTAHFLHSAVELPSGNIIAAGYLTAYGAFPDHGLLIKVNQHGCIDYDNCTPTNFPNVIIATTEVPAPEVKVFPNPTRQQLHILSDAVPLWDKIEVLDITGRIVYTVFNNNELTLESLSAGLYVLRLWKDGQFWTRRVVRR